MSDLNPMVRCEECNERTTERQATREVVPGYDGPITLYFCPGCSDA